MADVQKVIEQNDRNEFMLSVDPDTGELRIRTNQGHSLRSIENVHLEHIHDASEAPVVVHGTYKSNWTAFRAGAQVE